MEINKAPDRLVEGKKLAEALAKLPPRHYSHTGFDRLDDLVLGMRDGDLWVISGLTGSGKSQLAVSMARKMEDEFPLFLSYEMGAPELVERFGKEITNFALPLLATSSYPEWIDKKIVEAQEKYNTKVVFIDHLHYLIDPKTASNRNSSEIIGALVRQIKTIANIRKVKIVLLCHVRRINEKGGRPTLNDLRDSSNIANEADVVLILHRIGAKRTKEEDMDSDILITNDAWLYVDKCRHHKGRLGRVRLSYNEDGFYHEQE